MLDPTAGYLIVLGGALLLASAGAQHIRGLGRFTETFVAYRVLPEALARRSAWLLPGLELAIAIALVAVPNHRPAIFAAIGLLLAYASGIALNLARGRRDLDCGCGVYRARRSIAAWMVWRNLLVATALGVGVVPWASRTFGPTDWLTVGGGLIVAAALYSAADRLLGEIAPGAPAMRGSS